MQTIFDPVIEFFHFQDGNLAILFDPSGQSLERQAHSMIIPNFLNIKDEDQYPPYISVVAKNFTESVLGAKKIFLCEFFLIVDNKEYIIGKYQEIIAGKTKGFVRRMHYFGKTIADFEAEVIQKLSETFSMAWQNYIFFQNSNYNSMGMPQNNFKLPLIRKSSKNSGSNIKFACLVASAAVIPILIISLVWGIAKSTNKDPIRQAMLDSQNSQQAAQAQVDLTRETLKQMGLDPGKNGDVGCLAAPQ